jgi:AcrR family transcriptional regulator
LDRKTHVIEITRDLILADGIQAASMSKIGKLSKVPIGSIYNMFPSKEELINEVYRYSRDKYLSVDDLKKTQTKDSFKEAIMEIVEHYMDRALVHKRDYLFVEQYHLSPIINKGSRLPHDVVLGNFSIEEAIRHRIIKDYTPMMLSIVLLGIVNKAISAHFVGLICMNDKVKKQVLDTAWDAIKYTKE